jgi:hypothetical protein
MESMILTTTFKRLQSANACESLLKFLRESLKGVKDNDPINLLTILETNGLDETGSLGSTRAALGLRSVV